MELLVENKQLDFRTTFAEFVVQKSRQKKSRTPVFVPNSAWLLAGALAQRELHIIEIAIELREKQVQGLHRASGQFLSSSEFHLELLFPAHG